MKLVTNTRGKNQSSCKHSPRKRNFYGVMDRTAQLKGDGNVIRRKER